MKEILRLCTWCRLGDVHSGRACPQCHRYEDGAIGFTRKPTPTVRTFSGHTGDDQAEFFLYRENDGHYMVWDRPGDDEFVPIADTCPAPTPHTPKETR